MLHFVRKLQLESSFPFLLWLPGISKLNLFPRCSHHLPYLRVLAPFLCRVFIFLIVTVLWGGTKGWSLLGGVWHISSNLSVKYVGNKL